MNQLRDVMADELVVEIKRAGSIYLVALINHDPWYVRVDKHDLLWHVVDTIGKEGIRFSISNDADGNLYFHT